MIPLAQTLFPTTGAMGLLLQILGNLLFDNSTLHRPKQILGFIQGQPYIFGPQRPALQTSYAFNGLCVSAVGFNDDLHLDFHWPPPAPVIPTEIRFPHGRNRKAGGLPPCDQNGQCETSSAYAELGISTTMPSSELCRVHRGIAYRQAIDAL